MAHPFPWGNDLTANELYDICVGDIDYSVDNVYLITWNPNRRLVLDGTPFKKKWEAMIVKVLNNLRRCCDKYCIVPEISDAGRLHCHGWVVITDRIKWHKSLLPQMQRNGFVKMAKLRHVKGFEYSIKDAEVTAKILGPQCFMPYCHYNDIDIDSVIYQRIRNMKEDTIRRAGRSNALVRAIGIKNIPDEVLDRELDEIPLSEYL